MNVETGKQTHILRLHLNSAFLDAILYIFDFIPLMIPQSSYEVVKRFLEPMALHEVLISRA